MWRQMLESPSPTEAWAHTEEQGLRTSGLSDITHDGASR